MNTKRPDNYDEKVIELNNLITQVNSSEIDLFYADGSGFSMTQYIPYAWQEKGTTIEVPSFRSKTINLFGIWDAKENLNLYKTEGSLTSDLVIGYIDDFVKQINKRTILILDNASIHKSAIFKNKIEEWNKLNLDIFYLPTYSPHLNLIEILWRFMKYEWIEFSAYDSLKNLSDYIDNVAIEFGEKYTINFV